MKKLLTAILLLTIVGLTTVYAQRFNQYTCGTNSTAQQCQDAVNIDNLQIQLQSAQGAVQTIQQQLQGLGANIQAQLQQAQQSVQNIQSQITSNEADYQAQTLQTQLTTDTATLATVQAAANNLAGKSSMGAQTNSTGS